jgi:hypothetical protein
MLNDNATALAQGEPLPRRLGVFFWGNGRGIDASRWTPTGTGTTWELSPQLAPLASVKNYINVVSGSDIKLQDSPRGHHDGSVGVLSGNDFVAQDPGNAGYRSTFKTPSIDQIAAASIGQDSLYRSLEVGVSSRIVRGEGTTLEFISHNGPDNANPSEVDARAVFDRLFGGNDSGADTALVEATNRVRQSILDAITEDIGELKLKVGARDRVRLDQHFENIRAIETRLGSDLALAQRCLEVAAPNVPEGQGGQEPLAERTEAMSELVALALACDMTRVFSMLFTGSVGGTVFWQVGADRGHHELSHEGEASQSLIDASTIFTMEQFAVLLERLRDTPEGAGNVLDQSVILATSDASDGTAHSVRDYPIVIAGGGGGSLRTPGLHVAADGENTSKVLLTVLRAAGVPATEIGGGAGYANESFTAIET